MGNIGESIKTKLKNISRQKKVSVDFIQKRYVNERFLGRLSQSKWADKFCLKGGMMIPVLNNGDMYRPTTDIDFNGIGDGNIDILKEMVCDLFELKPKSEGGTLSYDDGLKFLPETLVIRKEREGIIPGGKLEFDVLLNTSKIKMRVDVGFGNPVIPKMDTNSYPSLLADDKKNPLPEPKVLMYSPYSMMAEKFHAIAQFGIYNTRIRDYYDLYFLSTHMDLDKDILSDAIRETFLKQERDLPQSIPGLSEKFILEKSQDWKRYISNSELSLQVPDLREVVETIRKTIEPSLDNIVTKEIQKKV